jgi:hypothetical protein
MSLSNVPLETVFSIRQGDGGEGNEDIPIFPDGYLTRVEDSSIRNLAEDADDRNLKAPDAEKFILRYVDPEKEDFELVKDPLKVLGIYSEYMRDISRRVEQKIESGKNPVMISQNAAFQRSRGSKNFVNFIAESGYFSPESYENHLDLINVLTESLAVMDIGSYEARTNQKKGSSALTNITALSVIKSGQADLAFDILEHAYPKNLKYKESYRAFTEGALAEILTLYAIINTKVLSENNVYIDKVSSYRDVFEGIDYVIKNEKGDELLYFDVKSEGYTNGARGIGLLRYEGGNIRGYSAGMSKDSIISEYGVEPSVHDTLRKRGIPFIIVRVPSDFNTYDSTTRVDIFDKKRYDLFSDQVSSEIRYYLREETY